MTKEQKATTRLALDCVTCALHAEEYGAPDDDCLKVIIDASQLLDDVIQQLCTDTLRPKQPLIATSHGNAADESMPDDDNICGVGYRMTVVDELHDSMEKAEKPCEETYQEVKARREAALTPSAKKLISARALAEETACAYETVCGWCREKHVKPYYKGFRLTEEEALAFKRDIGWEK